MKLLLFSVVALQIAKNWGVGDVKIMEIYFRNLKPRCGQQGQASSRDSVSFHFSFWRLAATLGILWLIASSIWYLLLSSHCLVLDVSQSPIYLSLIRVYMIVFKSTVMIQIKLLLSRSLTESHFIFVYITGSRY